MAARLQHNSRTKDTMGSSARAKGPVLGLIAGLVATIVVDLIMMGFLLFRGQPAENGFAVIGDTAAGFFSLFGIALAGGVLPGVVWHYLIGLAFGVIFGTAVTRFDALRLTSMKKSVGLGILYTEIMSIPMLVQVPIFLKGTASDTAGLLGFFLVMHAMWGLLLGVIVGYSLRSEMAARQE
ncbi:MAG: hypothetical protein HZB51_29730 [Chloroflexi bacterium]|nr:hypothetical protein [Chloroflexota bacterium]